MFFVKLNAHIILKYFFLEVFLISFYIPFKKPLILYQIFQIMSIYLLFTLQYFL